MKYKIETAYCWYNQGTQIVLMYFINHIPFTFDELPDFVMEDQELIKMAVTCQSVDKSRLPLWRYEFGGGFSDFPRPGFGATVTTSSCTASACFAAHAATAGNAAKGKRFSNSEIFF